MPVFKVNIDRKVTNYDRFVRLIEAETEKQAMELGQYLADAANQDCPDDAGPGSFDDELGDWSANDATLVAPEDVTDYAIVEAKENAEYIAELAEFEKGHDTEEN